MRRALKYMKLSVLKRPIRLIKAWHLHKSSHSISCHEFDDFIYDHLNGDLTDKQSTAFQRHVNDCPVCPNFLKAYISTYEARNHISPYENIDVADTAPQKLVIAILEAGQKT